MQYTVRHACGHEETVVLYGPTKERERRIALMEAEDCPSCRAAEAHLDGCVDLVGSDKQIAWAGQIRRSFLSAWEKDLQAADANLDDQMPKVQEQIEKMRAAGQDVKAQEQRLELVLDAADQCHAFAAALHREASASWWIENRAFAERDDRGKCLTDYIRMNGKSPVGLMMRDELKRDAERPHREGASMTKIEVLYSGGQSRYSNEGVDYMLARVPSSDGDMIELYAERDPADYVDEETAEAMRADHIDVDSLHEKYPDLENLTYDDLKADILAQAREKGIDPSLLHFWFDV